MSAIPETCPAAVGPLATVRRRLVLETGAKIGHPPLHADLASGRIAVDVLESDFNPADLFGFAQRRNPKRAFLFVSRVLGRHVPVAPSAMRAAFSALAAKLPSDLPGPVLVMGLAETAVGLGAGVHREYTTATGRDDAVYLTSTRHALGTPVLAHFTEDHSHATAHLVHEPTDPRLRTMVREARSCILVDDEITTGRTLRNLGAALIGSGTDRMERVVLATLTDWSGGSAGGDWPLPTSVVSLLSGRYVWTAAAGAQAPEMPRVAVGGTGAVHPDPALDWGRLGAVGHPAPCISHLGACRGDRILVLGTGEHVWRPFLLAEALEAAGCDVSFSAVTRSPIALGHAIGSALSFRDNYGLGISNFVYNVDATAFDRIVLCSETPEAAIDPVLIEALGPSLVVLSEVDRT